jgi:hypothetical protein
VASRHVSPEEPDERFVRIEPIPPAALLERARTVSSVQYRTEWAA